MDEKEVLNLLGMLKEIKPREEWVLSFRQQLFVAKTPEKAPFWSRLPAFNFRWVMAPVVVFGLLFGVIVLAQRALPGDLFYPVKRIAEKIETRFVAENEKPQQQIELTNRRVEELAQIAAKNDVKKLAPALNELATAKQAVKEEVAKLVKNRPEKEAVTVAKGLVPKLEELNRKEKQVLASLEIEVTKDEEPAEKTLVEILIKDAEKATLNENQFSRLAEAKRFYEAGDYKQALAEVLLASYPQP